MRYQTTRIFAAFAGLLLSTTITQAQVFDLSWHTIDGGGGFSSGGGFEIGATIGQPDAGVLSGGAFELAGGFWANAASASDCPGQRGDTNCDGGVDFFDIDPFLLALFDNPQYLAANCGGSNCAADVDNSGAVDFFDIDPFLMCLFAACP